MPFRVFLPVGQWGLRLLPSLMSSAKDERRVNKSRLIRGSIKSEGTFRGFNAARPLDFRHFFQAFSDIRNRK